MDLNLISLGPDEARFFASMTFPSYRHLLSMAPQPRHRDEADQRPIQPLAIAALQDRRPVGLALVELPLHAGFHAELLSLFVLPAERGNGVATALTGAVEQAVAAHGGDRVAATWMTGKPSVPALERVFAKRGFSTPRTRMVSVRFDAERMNEADWLHKYRPREGYEIFSWMDLRDDERERLRRSHAEQPWIAADLLPWEHDAHGFEPITSVGVRYRGDVVGWVINHRLDDKTVRYTCSFIRDDLARLGRILPLYRESFARMKRFGFRHGMFVTPLHHEPMARFALKWFGPWSNFVGETRGAQKVLTDAA